MPDYCRIDPVASGSGRSASSHARARTSCTCRTLVFRSRAPPGGPASGCVPGGCAYRIHLCNKVRDRYRIRRSGWVGYNVPGIDTGRVQDKGLDTSRRRRNPSRRQPRGGRTLHLSAAPMHTSAATSLRGRVQSLYSSDETCVRGLHRYVTR